MQSKISRHDGKPAVKDSQPFEFDGNLDALNIPSAEKRKSLKRKMTVVPLEDGDGDIIHYVVQELSAKQNAEIYGNLFSKNAISSAMKISATKKEGEEFTEEETQEIIAQDMDADKITSMADNRIQTVFRGIRYPTDVTMEEVEEMSVSNLDKLHDAIEPERKEVDETDTFPDVDESEEESQRSDAA